MKDVKTKILDARTIQPDVSAEQFLCEFYDMDPCSLLEWQKKMYEQEEPLITEVFNWPVQIPAWKEIAASLESVQQHSASFYVIWGPETENAIEYDQQLLKQKAR